MLYMLYMLFNINEYLNFLFDEVCFTNLLFNEPQY